METSRLLLMLSVAFLALAALIGAALIAYAHQRRERSSQVVRDALSRSGAAAANEAATPARPADLLRSLNGDGELPAHWLNTSLGKALVAQEDRILLSKCGWGRLARSCSI